MPAQFHNLEQGQLLLGIDTCGSSGSVAISRLTHSALQILGQIELEGRSYSSTLVAAVGEILAQHNATLRGLAAIVVVSGPGSFTGVRVGLSAVKGLAEAAQIPVAAVSRLAVLAKDAGISSAAIDAHRHEIFLRLGEPAQELLAGSSELAAIHRPPIQVAICDDPAAALLSTAWPGTELTRLPAPTAAGALQLAAPLVTAGDFVDLALLDGHYLRRSDAEIFGVPAPAAPSCPRTTPRTIS
jgi:tRNA threonylcarbamoyladenosine biosynthesis protein TsaB